MFINDYLSPILFFKEGSRNSDLSVYTSSQNPEFYLIPSEILENMND